MKKNIYIYKRRIGLIAIFLVLINFPSRSFSQSWSDVGGGMCDWVNAMTVYNGELIVGGRFTCAGGVPANYIAKWNGTTWDSLGSGMDGWVNALTVYNGELIAGGQFVNAGGVTVNNIARWDGVAWTDVSGGTNSIVSALTVYNNKLIAGGYFTSAESLNTNYIGAWDQNGWTTLGTGMGGSQGQVMALDTFGTDLIAAGFFTTAGGNNINHIAKWNGATWDSLGSGTNWIAYSLTNYNNNLIVGGYFASAGGIAANSIAKWNGTTWDSLGSGVGATNVGYDYVFALSVYQGNLYAGGMYLTAGGVLANGIAKWNGSIWTDLNGGTWYNNSNAYGVNAMSVYGNDLYAGGLFTTAGNVPVSHISKWNEPITSISTPSETTIDNFGNYPNPFSDITTIFFGVSKPRHVKLMILDIYGRDVSILADETKQPGNYFINFNGANLDAGIYLIKSETDTKSETIKMFLSK